MQMPAVSHGNIWPSSVWVPRGADCVHEDMGTSLGNLTAGNHHFGDSIEKVGRHRGRQERRRSRVLVMS